MKNEISDFASSIGAVEPKPGSKNHGIFRKLFKRSNYFVLEGQFVVIKISRSEKPFWGVGKSFIDFFNNTENYFLILLTSNKEGWCFNKSEIIHNVSNGTWRLRETDGNYKINTPLPDKNSFISPAQLLKKINITQPVLSRDS